MNEMDRAMMEADDPVFSRAFVVKMIERQGPVEMSRILLKYGKDTELRGVAEKGIKCRRRRSARCRNG